MTVSSKAAAAEKTTFNQLKSRFGTPIVSPAGFDAGFPDFAFRLELPSGKKVDLHFEYKADYTAQMGSMRDWIFDGRKFLTPDTSNESKQMLITIMNNTPEAVRNASKLLSSLQTWFDSRVGHIASSSLGVVRHQADRRVQLEIFASEVDNYQIAKISDTVLGKKIVDHYKHKFTKNLVSGSDASILFLMLKDTCWAVDQTSRITAADQQYIEQVMGGPLPRLPDLTAKLEVRIQPRGLNSPGKPVRIDTIAAFRLTKKPSGGLRII